MTPGAFIANGLEKEPPPSQADASGRDYAFERAMMQTTGMPGIADVCAAIFAWAPTSTAPTPSCSRYAMRWRTRRC